MAKSEQPQWSPWRVCHALRDSPLREVQMNRKPKYLGTERKEQHHRFREAMERIDRDNKRCIANGIPLARFTAKECADALRPLKLTGQQERLITEGIILAKA
jgi:hypothetical protein